MQLCLLWLLEDFDLTGYVPAETELIISGGAGGVDAIAEKYADVHRISKLILRPQYELYGRGAPIRRNEMMVDIADLVIVRWDGAARGAKYPLDYARKKGKQIGQKQGVTLNVKKKEPIKRIIKSRSKDFYGTLKDIEVIAIINSTSYTDSNGTKKKYHVSNNTYYKYKKELADDLKKNRDGG